MTLGLAFLAGLLGSAHCVGMCGGFSLALAHRSQGAVWPRLGLYHTGRIATYTALGALAGTFGYALFLARGTQLALSVGLGIVLVVTGLGVCGVLRRWAPLDKLPIPTVLGRAVGKLVQHPSAGAALGLGMVNGLLPCGLVLALLVQAAAAGHPARGALTMLAFGTGTLPALALTVWAGQWWSVGRRMQAQKWAGVLLVVMGVLTIARATPLEGMAHASLHGDHATEQVAGEADVWCRLPG